MKRRQFLRNVGATGVAVSTLPTLVDNFAVKAIAGGDDKFARLMGDSDRILVLIQLGGGNDGLNTVIPVENQTYYDSRPSLAISKNESLKLTDTLGWHPAMAGFRDMYDDGRMAVIQGVTYPNPNRSHFRGTDIWLTATDPEVFGSTGWIGRYLDTMAPGFPVVLPPAPLAVQIGTSSSLGLQGPNGAMGVSFRNPEEFHRIVNSGGAIEEVPRSDLGDTPAGREVAYLSDVARSADVYADVVKAAADKAQDPSVTYPTTDIGSKLRVISQLISGGLQSKVFLVSWANNNFDTHANQVNPTDPTVGSHAQLLSELAGAVAAFMDDMKNQGLGDKVAGMTFSEFGRRVAENGSTGTDHGTAAPLFVFGTKVNGAVYGNDPDLENLDERGDMLMQNDYRDIYASVLLQWFGEPKNLASDILYKDFSSTALPLFETQVSVEEDKVNNPNMIGFRNVSPNPAQDDVLVRVSMGAFSEAGLDVRNLQGRMLASAPVDAFSGTARLNVSSLPSGAYVLTLRSGSAATHTLLHVKR